LIRCEVIEFHRTEPGEAPEPVIKGPRRRLNFALVANRVAANGGVTLTTLAQR
jgi:hypothetical protein